MERAKISSKNQVVIPKKIRKALGLHGGDEILFEPGDGIAIIMPKPNDYVEYMRGLGADIWESVNADEYLKGERESWEKRID